MEQLNDKQTWETMELMYVGNVSEVVLGGGGKLSTVSGDPGEPQRKPKGQDQFDPGNPHPGP
jgi:hypothetical protein